MLYLTLVIIPGHHPPLIQIGIVIDLNERLGSLSQTNVHHTWRGDDTPQRVLVCWVHRLIVAWHCEGLVEPLEDRNAFIPL